MRTSRPSRLTFAAPCVGTTAAPRRDLPIAVLVLVCALALCGVDLGTRANPAGASEAIVATGSSFTFDGGGWGHGLGMSQWGARGMSANGSTHRQILEHYYTGAKVTERDPGANLRILVAQHAAQLTLTAGGSTTFEGAGSIGAGETVTLTRTGGSIRLTGALTATVSAPLTVRQHGSALKVSPPGYSYRHGHLVVRTDASGGLRAIVSGLPMNQYLWGLHEMPSSWPREALKAQAVAARTFALKRRAARAGADFDLYATVVDQAYTGTLNERDGNWHLNWVAAVEETQGKADGKVEVVTHGGALIDAVYSASSGGRTENSENVWIAALPYLKSVPDPHDAAGGNPNGSWTRTYTGSQLGSWFGVGTVTSISILGPFGVSGRVDKADVRLVGTGGTKIVSGTSFRSTINSRNTTLATQLPSTKFEVTGKGAPPAAANRPPSGTFHTAFSSGRTVIIGGRATDPDGAPRVKVVSTMGTQVATRVRDTVDGSFLVTWDGAPGTRKVCVSVLDVPSGAETSLGCRDVVVK